MVKVCSLLAALVVSLSAFADGGNPLIPFLAITGRPTEAELVRKVASVKESGFDSFLIYARSGLQIPYLGDEWFAVVETLCREADRNFFLPAAFLSGAIARQAGGIGRLPARLRFGSLAEQGLGDYCGTVTYRLEGVVPESERLRLATGGLFTRIRWNGADLGVRAWEPYEWDLPSGGPGNLDVTVYTPVVRIMGDVDCPGADWDIRFWTPPSDAEYDGGLFAPGKFWTTPKSLTF